MSEADTRANLIELRLPHRGWTAEKVKREETAGAIWIDERGEAGGVRGERPLREQAHRPAHGAVTIPVAGVALAVEKGGAEGAAEKPAAKGRKVA